MNSTPLTGSNVYYRIWYDNRAGNQLFQEVPLNQEDAVEQNSPPPDLNQAQSERDAQEVIQAAGLGQPEVPPAVTVQQDFVPAPRPFEHMTVDLVVGPPVPPTPALTTLGMTQPAAEFLADTVADWSRETRNRRRSGLDLSDYLTGYLGNDPLFVGVAEGTIDTVAGFMLEVRRIAPDAGLLDATTLIERTRPLVANFAFAQPPVVQAVATETGPVRGAGADPNPPPTAPLTPLDARAHPIRAGQTCSVCHSPISGTTGICEDCSERAAVPVCIHCGCALSDNTGICVDCANNFPASRAGRTNHLGTFRASDPGTNRGRATPVAIPALPPELTEARHEDDDNEDNDDDDDDNEDQDNDDDNDDHDDDDPDDDDENDDEDDEDNERFWRDCPECSERVRRQSTYCNHCDTAITPLNPENPVATENPPSPPAPAVVVASLVNNEPASDLLRQNGTLPPGVSIGTFIDAQDNAMPDAIATRATAAPNLYAAPARATAMPAISDRAYAFQAAIQAQLRQDLGITPLQFCIIFETIFDGVMKGFLMPNIFSAEHIKNVFASAFIHADNQATARTGGLMMELFNRQLLGNIEGFDTWFLAKWRFFRACPLCHNPTQIYFQTARMLQHGYVNQPATSEGQNSGLVAVALDHVIHGRIDNLEALYRHLRDQGALAAGVLYGQGTSLSNLLSQVRNTIRNTDIPSGAMSRAVSSFGSDQQIFLCGALCWMAQHLPFIVLEPSQLLTSNLPSFMHNTSRRTNYLARLQDADMLFVIQRYDSGAISRPMYESMPVRRIETLHNLVNLTQMWAEFMTRRTNAIPTAQAAPVAQQVIVEHVSQAPAVNTSEFERFIKRATDELHNLAFVMALSPEEKVEMGKVLSEFYAGGRCNASVLSKTAKALREGEFFKEEPLSDEDQGLLFAFLSRTMSELTGNKSIAMPATIKINLKAEPFRRLYDASKAVMDAYAQGGFQAAQQHFDGFKDAFLSVKPEEVPAAPAKASKVKEAVTAG